MSLPPPDHLQPALLQGAPAPPDPAPDVGDWLRSGAASTAVSDAEASFSAFYRSSWEQVARGLTATLGDRDLAAEATDEAMARAYERWGTVGGYDFPAGWVYRVGLNWARSHHRRLARALPLRRTDHAELGAIADPAVRGALLGLHVRHRSVVVCRIFLDWTVEETASALRIAPGTVKSRLARALTILESTLGHLR
jgi:DNA-directed RNA polymerase specialized sigma24 family protein